MIAQLFQLHDHSVRLGEAPGDRLVLMAPVATLSTSDTVQTPFAPGTKVAICPFKIVEVDASGQLTLGVEDPAAGDAGGYLVLAPGYSLQGGLSQ